MKRLSMIMVCLLAMMAASLSAKAQEVTITLYPGWTWISYPNAETMDISSALGDFVPASGDIILSQYSSSTYVNGYWRGGVTHFIPGWGYMYYSNRTEAVSFVFGDTAPQLTVTTAEPTEITANSAVSGGSITSNDGNYIYVFMKGICWATHPNPMVMNDFFTENGSGAESFTAVMTDLTPNTEYYVRAYAVTLDGTFYGEELSFTTSQLINYTITVSANPTNGGTVTGGGTFQQGQSCTVTAIANNGYTFTNWTVNGSVVSSIANYTFAVTGNRNLVANFITQPTVPIGAINGLFSVSATRQVYFSRGNLQYKASTNTWRFAEHQWDYVGTQTPDNNGNVGGTVNGSDNANISSNYSGWIDLFGWGTSGWNSGNTYYHPWDSNNSDGSLYGPPERYYGLTGSYANADWGVYNSISNGNNTTNQWRTLTQSEWDYVFNSRNTTSGIRYAKAKVNNVNGVILLPDDWSSSTYSLSNTNTWDASFSSNTIYSYQWTTLESAGAVFLPAAGVRSGTWVSEVGSVGRYWSATHDWNTDNFARLVHVSDYLLSANSNMYRYYGLSVRLVQDY